jgi:hypothetical protein
MSTIVVDDVSRKKAKPEPEPQDRERKPMAIQIRGETKWKTWVDELSTFDERPVAMIIERALREYAEKIGFPKSPPKR